MNCLWKDVPNSADERGWHRVECKRCGRITAPTPHSIQDIHADCLAPPLAHELGHWLTLILEAVFIRKRDYLWLKARLGLAPKCGCDKRTESLNTLGQRLLQAAFECKSWLFRLARLARLAIFPKQLSPPNPH